LHGVGISVVNALSEMVEVTVWRDKRVYTQRFERGIPVTELKAKPTKEPNRELQSPSSLTYFTTNGIEFDYNPSRSSARLAYLNAGVKITFTDSPPNYSNSEPRVETYEYKVAFESTLPI